MVHPKDVTAVVLTGGKSTRMGRDKAFVPIAGRPLVAYTLEGLEKVFTRILLSANEPELYKPFGLPVVEDLERGWGALAGVHAALHAAPTEWVFALAVDMPLVEPGVIRLVLESAEPGRAAVIPHGLGYHQPFHAAYGPRARAILDAHGDQPFHVHEFAKHPEVYHLPEEKVREVSPSMNCFLNANTPEELHEIATLLRGREKAG